MKDKNSEKRHEKKDKGNKNESKELFIPNYQQNKEFSKHVDVSCIQNLDQRFLKIKTPDYLTFFRIQHEIGEIKRKKERFLEMKEKYFDKKDPEDLIKYDQNIRCNCHSQENDETNKKVKNSLAYLKGRKIGEKLNPNKNYKEVLIQHHNFVSRLIHPVIKKLGIDKHNEEHQEYDFEY